MALLLNALRASQLKYRITTHAPQSILFSLGQCSRPHPIFCYSTIPNAIKSRNPIVRVANYFRNDPFARVSVMFGATVLVVLLIIEAFIPKPQKRVKPQVAVLPPKATHPVVGREELVTLVDSIPSFYSMGPSVAIVTGPSGSGKTELVTQFAQQFLEHCSPWLMTKPSKNPIVLYLDASNSSSLSYTACFCAHALGIKTSGFKSCDDNDSTYHDPAVIIGHMFNKLAEQKAKWLVIVDGLTEETAEVVQGSLGNVASSFKHRKGYILLTSRTKPDNVSHPGNLVSLSSGLSEQIGTELLAKLSGQSHDQLSHGSDLIKAVGHSPLSLALAGLTIRLYKYFWESAPVTSSDNDPASLAVSSYVDALKTDRSRPCAIDERVLLNKALELYIEAVSTCDSYFIHSIDFLGSCDQAHPIPVSALKQHLKKPFYRLQGTPGTNPLSAPDSGSLTLKPLTPPTNYLSLIKSKLPIIGGPNPQEEIQQQMQRVESPSDPLEPTMMSPFLRLSSLTGYDVELIHTHPSAHQHLRDHFLTRTVPLIEADELKHLEDRWDRTAWFKQFRSFDSSSSRMGFLSALPGLKEGRAFTEHQYCQVARASPLSYSQYLQMASHYHRIATTFFNEVKYLGKDMEDLFVRKHLLPHVEFVLSSRPNELMKTDALSLEVSLLSIHSSLSDMPPDTLLKQYDILLEAHRELFGSAHAMTASVLTAMAEIHYQKGEYQEAEGLLKQAISIHESVLPRLRTAEQSTDHASTLSHLGLVYAAMGFKQQCCKYLEQALTLYQTISTEGDITKTQRKLVATTVTDLAHAYIMLGDTISAKKYLDLAVFAQRGIHGNYHPEVARTLNVLSIVHALMGDNPESRSVAREAGEIHKELTLVSDII